MRARLHLFPLLLLILLAGCVTVAPQTAAQRLAVVDTQFAAAVDTASDLRASGILTDAMRAELDPVIRDGDRALTLAWAALGKGQPDTALDYVVIVNRLLLELRAVLAEAQP